MHYAVIQRDHYISLQKIDDISLFTTIRKSFLFFITKSVTLFILYFVIFNRHFFVLVVEINTRDIAASFSIILLYLIISNVGYNNFFIHHVLPLYF